MTDVSGEVVAAAETAVAASAAMPAVLVVASFGGKTASSAAEAVGARGACDGVRTISA